MYDKATPFIQIAGFLIMVVFTAGIYFSKFTAMAATADKQQIRIEALETHYSEIENRYAHIEQRLDDMCDFFHVPPRRTK